MNDAAPEQWLLMPRPWSDSMDGATALAFSQGWPWQLPGCAAAMAWLQAQDCTGKILAFGCEDCPATVSILQAATLTGTTLVMLNRRLDAATLTAQLRRSGAVCLITHPGHPLHGDGITVPESFSADHALAVSGAVSGGGLILFTGGTTGVPKPALISAPALMHAAYAGAAALGLISSERWLAVLPLDHIAGVMTVLRAAVAGCSIELHRRFQLESADARLDRCHGVALVPTQLHRLVSARERSARRWSPSLGTLLIGGAALTPELAQRSSNLGLAPQQAYGMTETAAMVSVQRAHHVAQRVSCGTVVANNCGTVVANTCGTVVANTCGTVVPGMELAVCDEDGQPLQTGKVGRIAVRGGSLFSGYIGEHGQLDGAPIDGQWWFTGDLGVMGADGQLQLHGRRDDLIISGGENMYPLEIEALLTTHPMIREAAVVGLADPEWGHVVAAAVVLHAEPTPSTAWDRDAFTTWLSTHLGHRRPRHLVVLAQLPRTALGKLDRREVRRSLEENKLGSD